MRIVWRNIRSNKRAAMIVNTDKIATTELKSELDPIRKAILLRFKKVVEDWTSDVDFGARSFITPSGLGINVFPTGSDKDIWNYVDQGTRPHSITPKKSSVLRFKTNYKARTFPKPARVAIGGNAGKSTGPWVSAKSVRHPGIVAREFTKQIGDDSKDFFRNRVEAAFKRAQRKINKK